MENDMLTVHVCPNWHDKEILCEDCNKPLQEKQIDVDEKEQKQEQEERREYDRQQRFIKARLVP
jgi:hypothetical protein